MKPIFDTIKQSTLRSRHLRRAWTPLRSMRPLQHLLQTTYARLPVKIAQEQEHREGSYDSRISGGIMMVLFLAVASAKLQADIASDTDQINEDELSQYIDEGWENLKTVAGKDIVLVMGNTGSGKSTLINHLIGNKLEEKQNSHGYMRWYRVSGDNAPGPKISEKLSSETLYPQVYRSRMDNDTFFYCDLPGFQDNRSKTTKIWTHVARDLAVKISKEVVSIIIVISDEELAASRGENFKILNKILTETLSLGSDFNIPASINIVLTTTNGNKKPKHVEASLVELKKEKESDLDKIKNQIRWLKLSDSTKKTLQSLSQNSNDLSSQDLEELKEARSNNPTLIRLGEEADQLKKEIDMLDTLLKKAKIFIAKDYGNPETREAIHAAITQQTTPFGKDRLQFTRPKDSHRFYFDPYLERLLRESQALFNKQASAFSEWKAVESELKILKTALESQDSQAKTSSINIQELITAKSKEVARYQEEIQKLTREKQELDSADPYLYWHEHNDERRSWFGFFGYTEHEFKYPGQIKFLEAKNNPGKASRSCFIPIEEDKEKAVYRVKYQTGFYENADGHVQVYIEKRDYPEHKARIEEITLALKENETKRHAIENELTDLGQQYDAQMLQKKSGEYQRKLNEKEKGFLAAYGQISEEKLSQCEAIAQIMRAMESEQADRFFQELAECFYIRGLYLTDVPSTQVLAKKAFEQSVKYYPAHLNANLKLALSCQQAGEDSKCLQYLRSAAHHGSKEAEIELQGKGVPIFDLGYDTLNPYVYSIMAELAYCNPKDFQRGNGDIPAQLFKQLQGLNWEFLIAPNEQKGYQDKTGYQGIAFIHKEKKQIVIAHRGTKNKKSIVADLAMLHGAIPDQYLEGAKIFTKNIIEQYSKEGYIISHTGHSLGGSLAALSAYETRLSATIFDPYGVQKLLFKSVGKEFDINQLPITTYLSRVNIVNGSAPHVGLVLEIQSNKPGTPTIPDLGIQFMQFCFVHFSQYGVMSYITQEVYDDLFKAHNMGMIRGSFDTESKLPTSLGLVRKWPTDPVSVFAHHDFVLGQLGSLNKTIDIKSFPDPKNVFRVKMIPYEVQGVYDDKLKMKKLDAKFFPPEFIMLLKNRKNNLPDSNNYGIDPNVLKICELTHDTSTDLLYVSISGEEPIDMLQLKSYVDRKLSVYHQLHAKNQQGDSRELHRIGIFSHQIVKKDEGLTKEDILLAGGGAVVGAAAGYWFGSRGS